MVRRGKFRLLIIIGYYYRLLKKFKLKGFKQRGFRLKGFELKGLK